MADRRSTSRLLVVHWDGADEALLRPLLEAGHLPTLARFLEAGEELPVRAEASEAPTLWTTLATGPEGDAPWWDRNRSAGLRTHVVGWPYSAPLVEGGLTVTPDVAPTLPEAAATEGLADRLGACQVEADEMTPALLAPFVPSMLGRPDTFGPEAVRPLNVLNRTLAATASVHAAATLLLEEPDWDALLVHYDGLARLRAQFDRFNVGPDAFVPGSMRERFGQVVVAAARFHDMMLERLLELAGEEANVVLIGMPRLTFEPSAIAPVGFLSLRGAQRPPRSHPLDLSDVVPTLAEYAGLSLPERPTAYNPTADSSTPLPAGHRASHLEQARRHLRQGRPAEALPILDALYADSRDPADGMQLLRCYLRLKRPSDARTTLDRLLVVRLERVGDPEESADLPASLWLLQAKVLHAEKAYREAYESLQSAEAKAPQTALFYRRLGAVYLQLHAWPDAERTFRHALTIAPRFAAVHRWLAVALIRQGDYADALDAATRAAELRDPFPAAHYHRAIALLRLGRPAEAAEAAEVCVAQQPHFDRARYLLTELYRDHLDQPARAMKHLLAMPPASS